MSKAASLKKIIRAVRKKFPNWSTKQVRKKARSILRQKQNPLGPNEATSHLTGAYN